ncbi:MAG: hypothetical protein RIC87_06395 [Kiloniellales bacterium]
MSDRNRVPLSNASVRRILIALDSSRVSEDALSLAADIAAATASELAGVFVEDQDLLHLAELPFSREVQRAGAASRNLQRDRLLQDLRAQAALAKAALVRQADLRRITWSFHIAQGRSEEAILTAAGGGDIIAMTRQFGPLGQAAKVSPQIRRIVARAPAPLLVFSRTVPIRPGPTLLPFDASEAAERMLPLAAELTRLGGGSLEVLLLNAAAASSSQHHARLAELVGTQAAKGMRVWSPRDRATALRRLCEADRGLLLLPADSPSLTAAHIEQILESAQAPILLQMQGVADERRPTLETSGRSSR